MVVVDCLSNRLCHTNDVRHYGIQSGSAVRDQSGSSTDSWKEVISNKEPNFIWISHIASELWKSKSQLHCLLSTDGQPDGAGQPGSWQVLWLFMNQCQDDWDKWLSIAEFTYMTIPCFDMILPLHAWHWEAPLAQHGTLRESCLETLNDLASRMEKATDEHTQPPPSSWWHGPILWHPS